MSQFKFGIAWKLLAVCLAFGLPIIVMFVLMTNAKLTEINFASKEMVGDSFQRPLEEALQHVARHRRLWARGRRGDASVASDLTAEARAIETALRRLEATDAEYGAELQFTAEGLGLRKRSEFTARGLHEKWRRFSAKLVDLGVPDAQAGYEGLVAHIRTMITHAGDSSNLILDPDLDSYYFMDVTLLALPQLEDRLQQVAVNIDELAFRSRLTLNDKVEVAKSAAFLQEADWDRVAASSETALNEDQNFHGVSPTFASSIRPHLKLGAEASARVVARLKALSSQESLSGFDLAGFRADVERLDDELYRFHEDAFEQEDVLLRLRIADFRKSLYAGFVLAGISVLLSALLAFALAANVVRRVLRMSAATDAFAKGNMRVRVGPAGSDEIGDLGRSFDSMTDRIGALTGNLEKMVEERTAELSRRNREFALILDNAHDGMLTADLLGNLSSERSATSTRWFGVPEPGATLADYLGRDNPALAADLRLGLEELRADIMPIELTLDQLPKRMESGGKEFQLSYQQILEHEVVTRLLVIVSDITSEMEGARAAALQQQTLRIFQACQRDRTGFLDFFVEARDIVDKVAATNTRPSEELRRAIHTLKGNCGLFGVLSLSALCHDIETNMEETCGVIVQSDVERLQKAWAELSETVTQILGSEAERKLEIGDEEYASIVDSIAGGDPRKSILAAIAKWKLEPSSRRLARIAEQAQRMAQRLGKHIKVTVEPSDIRLCAETWAPVWSALVHVVRNAVDHGIEVADERIQKGKPAAGQLTLRTGLKRGRVFIEISDDGRGIRWDAVAQKAKVLNLGFGTHAELVEAVFADGLSTKDVLTDVSGRGIGMSAIREACRALGGSIDLVSESGRGTSVYCSFPEAVMGGNALSSVASRAVNISVAPP